MASPIGHALIGATLYIAASRTAPDASTRTLRNIAIASTLAALPDADMLVGWMAYGDRMAIHRFASHGIFFAAMMALAVALVYRIERGILASWWRYALFLTSHTVVDMLSSPEGPGIHPGEKVALLAPFTYQRWTSPFSIFYAVDLRGTDPLVSMHGILQNTPVFLSELMIGIPLVLAAVIWKNRRMSPDGSLKRSSLWRQTSPWVVASAAMILGLLGTQVVFHMVKTSAAPAQLVGQPAPVELAMAKEMPITETVGAGGTLQQSATVNLKAAVAGRVLSMPSDLGAVVNRGEVLVRLDDRILIDAEASARESLNYQEVSLEQAMVDEKRFTALFNEGHVALSDLEAAKLKVAEMKSMVAQSRAALTRAQMDLEHATVRAPFGAIILSRNVNPGEMVKQDDVLMTIGNIETIDLVADVGEEKVSNVHLDQPAKVTLDAFPGDVFDGRIVKIDPKTDPKSRAFQTYVRMSNPKLQFKPGLTGFARIQDQRSGVLIPSVAIINPVAEQVTVFVVDAGGIVHIIPVKIGVVSGGQTQVVEGLSAGDRVVTAGQVALREGNRVSLPLVSESRL